MPSTRRRLLLDTAVHVVATSGLRGLTHRAVDRAAGLPEGTCSAYLRTRLALVSAVGEHVAGKLDADVRGLGDDAAACAGDHERVVALTSRLFLRWLESHEVLVARFELAMEATRDPALAAVLAGWRDQLVGVVEGMLDAGGHDRGRAPFVVAALDGVLLGALARAPRDRRRYVEAGVALVLSTMAEA
jgi:DNA-binding transcriptional regulator YbjK